MTSPVREGAPFAVGGVLADLPGARARARFCLPYPSLPSPHPLPPSRKWLVRRLLRVLHGCTPPPPPFASRGALELRLSFGPDSLDNAAHPGMPKSSWIALGDPRGGPHSRARTNSPLWYVPPPPELDKLH
ncbi:hypothetical protein K523DRAFT_150589 [Schizophyllum commune Tattone D]|nr:hypothetical protein K523DRAFT_150589 [Schizophyllum commune Tattone D]